MNSLPINKTKSKFQKLDRGKVIAATGAIRHNNGSELYFMGHCPVHDDKNPSLKITGEPHDAKVHCFGGCDWKTVRDALLARGCAAFDADNLDETYISPARRDTDKKGAPADDCWEIVYPIPDDAPFPMTEFKKGYPPPAAHWEYLDRNCKLIFYVFRYDLGGGKDVVPQTLWKNKTTGAFEWRWKAFPAPRPLYNLHLLAAHPDRPVSVMEGEKATDAAAKLLPGHVVITSSGGCQAAGKTDWTPLAGRDVIIWPDADDSGKKYAEDVARLAHKAGASSVKILPILDGKISGWDAANAVAEGWTPEQAAEYLATAEPWQPPADNAPTGAADNAQADKPTKPICLADVQPVPVSWLWEGRIARGKITLIAGNPGLGKSFLALDLAARVSTGMPFPDGTPGCQGKVFLLSAEDDMADTIRPRLDAAGADCGNILARRYGDLGNLDAQLPQLETDLKNERPVLLVIDPITAFLGRLDAHRNDEIRSLFARLTELAARYGVAVVVISHLNKSTAQGTALHRVTGSLGFTAAARAAYLVERDPANPDDRLFLPLKNNLGEDLTGFRFRLIGEPGSVPCLEWDPDPVTITADEVLAQKSGKEPTAQAEAEAWLRDALADGPLESNRLRQMALRDGYSWTTLKRAKKSIGAVAKRDRFHEGQWFWSLPEEDQSDETWSPSDFTSEEDQPSPKKTKINEHETWSSSANLVPFDESSPAPCEEDQPTDTWSSSTDKSPVDESGPVVEEEF